MVKTQFEMIKYKSGLVMSEWLGRKKPFFIANISDSSANRENRKTSKVVVVRVTMTTVH